jgi:hypothetical protein
VISDILAAADLDDFAAPVLLDCRHLGLQFGNEFSSVVGLILPHTQLKWMALNFHDRYTLCIDVYPLVR